VGTDQARHFSERMHICAIGRWGCNQSVESEARTQPVELEDEVLVDEFCSLLASVAIRILASEGQEVYNCSSSDKKGASKL